MIRLKYYAQIARKALLIVPLSVSLSSPAWAIKEVSSTPLKNNGQEAASWSGAMELYKKGSYNKANIIFKQLEKDKKLGAMAHYLQGLCYNKLQQFDQSDIQFTKALAKGSDAADIYYEHGQALYAMNELKKARRSFARSIKHNYLVASCLYYIGFISQTLEEYPLAIKYYKKIPQSSKDVSQAASMQIAEVIYKQAKDRKDARKIVRDYVLPQLDMAEKIDSSSSLVADIQKRSQELKDQFDLDENKMLNGRKIAAERNIVRFTETLNYDSNVISEADEAPTKATAEFKGSLISKSNLTYQHIFVFQRRYIVTPEVKLTFDHHFRRKAPEIYKNDQYSLIPKVEGKLEHTLFNEMATFAIEEEFSYQEKDTGKVHDKRFYGRTFTLTMSEKFKLLKIGESNFKIKRKDFQGQTDATDSYTNGLSLSQTISMPAQHLLLALLSAEWTNLPHDLNSSSDSYIIRFDYVVPNVYKEMRMTGAMSTTFLDTKRQSATRGTEKTYNPSISFARNFTKYFELTLKYDFTKNVSRAKSTNAYTKHVYGLEGMVKF